MKTLISWVAFNNDFREGKVDKENSPNYTMHKLFWDFDRHIILSSCREEDIKLDYLTNQLGSDFPDHTVETRYMNIDDVINLSEIKTKVETFLLGLGGDEITIFFSPGTSAMQVVWYICHTSLGLKTRLIQVRPAAKTKTRKPELLEIRTEHSTVPVTAILKENILNDKGRRVAPEEDYLITGSLKPVYHKAEMIAQTDMVTVLILGETGTGKEHLARYVHNLSGRKDKPYVTINCSAFNDSLLESRLFGYKKGAFTGADKDTEGLFTQADGGTIFLDEIGDITPYMQQVLLRVLQEKEIQPVGGKPRKVSVRIISATNKNLVDLCREGKFRWDLYYRLAVAELELPGLRERGATEIVELLTYFIKRKRTELRKESPLELESDVERFLQNYAWPGNVRELENLVETLYVFQSGQVKLDNLPARFMERTDGKSLKWEDVECAHIKYVLDLKKGNLRQTWMALGYGSYNTLMKRLKDYGIDPEDYA